MSSGTNVFRRFKFLAQSQGLGRALRMGFRALLINPVIDRYSYLRYSKKYPINLIYIASYAKSGSSWFAHMLGELEGFHEVTPRGWAEVGTPGLDPHPIYEGFVKEFNKRLVIAKGHSWGSEENIKALCNQGLEKYIVTTRDPRDALISAYWYIRQRPHHWDYKNVSSMELKEFIDFKLNSGEFENQFVGWLRGWSDKLNKGCLLVRYEDLLQNPKQEMSRVFEFLGIEISETQVELIVEKHSFKKVSGREHGQEDNSNFVRKAVSNEWKTVLTAEQSRFVSKIASDVLTSFGYEL